MIVPASQARKIFDPCRPLNGVPVTSYWTPDSAEITSSERALRLRLDADLAGLSSGVDGRDYVRQYVGIESEGRRLIYIAGLHNDLVAKIVSDHNALPFYERWWEVSPTNARYWMGNGFSFCDVGRFAFAAVYNPANDSVEKLVFSSTIR